MASPCNALPKDHKPALHIDTTTLPPQDAKNKPPSPPRGRTETPSTAHPEETMIPPKELPESYDKLGPKAKIDQETKESPSVGPR